jgi:hypothetical protein
MERRLAIERQGKANAGGVAAGANHGDVCTADGKGREGGDKAVEEENRGATGDQEPRRREGGEEGGEEGGVTFLVVSHANTIRALMAHFDAIEVRKRKGEREGGGGIAGCVWQ